MKGMRGLFCNLKSSKIRTILFSALVAAGVVQLGTTAMAAEGEIAERDILDQAVALYEKLSGEAVAMPNGMNFDEEEFIIKSVALGFVNADEIDNISDSTALRKQDVMTVLYKTIINFDDSYALSSGEVDEILNSCNENALIDEENRAGYAFMIKHGIANTAVNTEPNKSVTWDGCRILVDVLYNIFMQDVTFNTADVNVVIGANIDTITSVIGEPDRIDTSDYGFDWYVYNSDYSKFMMVGVDNDRICAFFSNSDSFSLEGIKSGDSLTAAYRYMKDSSYRFFEKDGKIDAVMFNTQDKIRESSEIDGSIRAAEIIDIINANRVKNSLEPLKIDEDKLETVQDMSKQAKYKSLSQDNSVSHELNGAFHESGYDIFGIYSKLIESDNEALGKGVNVISVGADTIEGYHTMSSIMVDKVSEAELAKAKEPREIAVTKNSISSEENNNKSKEHISFSKIVKEVNRYSAAKDEVETTIETVSSETKEKNAPVIVNPVNEAVIPEGSDCVIELEKSVADEYAVKIFSIEDEEYIVNSYIKTKEKQLTFNSALFESGKDYVITVSAVTEDETIEGEEITVRYGEVSENDISMVSPITGESIDDDSLHIEWESEKFHDFIVDIYDSEGKLALSEKITDANSADIENIAPGNYFVYVSAIRRDNPEVVKIQCDAAVTIALPQPVITEHILEPGEKFYPVYEDKDMGLLCFYDEDIVDVETVDENGNSVMVSRKKITEKQVKSVNYYEQLAKLQNKVEYFEGSNTLQTVKSDEVQYVSPTGDMSINGRTVYNGEIGNAVVKEAEKYLGVPYVWGGTTPAGFDCSGLVQYVYKSLGIDISRVTYTQVNEGVEVSKDELQPGDLVFFAKNGDVHHVGIYAGNDMMIHAPHTGAVVEYQSLNDAYYADSFYCGRRMY